MRSSAVAVLIVCALLTPTGQARAATGSGDDDLRAQLHRELQDLDRELQLLPCPGQLAAGKQQALPQKLSEEARAHHSLLVNPRRRAASLLAGERDALVAKIQRLKRLATAGHNPAAQSTVQASRVVADNDACTAAFPVSDGTWVGSTAGASNDGHASCGASYSSPDVWFRYTATSSGLVGANTFGSGYDTVLSVHESCPGTSSNLLACNDDTSGLQSAVGFTAEAGEVYLIRVSGFGDATGTFALTVGPGAAITGTVGQAGTMRPISDVTVEVFDQDGFLAGSGVSDADGAYRVDGLLTGTYFATTLHDGDRIDQLYDGISCPGGAGRGCDPLTGTAITASIGTVTSGIDFGLPPGGTISGTVSEAGTGVPVPAAEVTVYDPEGRIVASGLSIVSGAYSAGGLVSGRYTVAASHPEHTSQLFDNVPCAPLCDPAEGTAVAVTVGHTTSGIDFILAREGAISGSVSDQMTGDPIIAKVTVLTGDGVLLKSTASDSAGRYVLGGLDAGSYLVMASSRYHIDELYEGVACEEVCDLASATPVTVVDGATTSGIDLALHPLGQISGMVTERATGNPIPFVAVTLYDVTGSIVEWSHTQADGSYTITELMTGYYFAKAGSSDHFWELLEWVDELYDDRRCTTACYPMDGTVIPVASGATTTGIDFALDRLVSIAGSVTDAGTGRPLSGVRVEAWFGDPPMRVGYRYTGTDGRYELMRLVNGSYLVVTNGAGLYSDALYNGVFCPGGPWTGCDPGSATPVVVANGATTDGIYLALQPQTTGGIAGQVMAAGGGEPVSGVQVLLYDPAGERVTTPVTTDTAGLYEYRGVQDGSYFVVALDDAELADELYNDIPCMGCDPTGGTPVLVENGGMTRHVDFELELGGVLSGQVSDATTGWPMDARVTVWTVGGTRVEQLTTDDAGSYRFAGLTEGRYLLGFEGYWSTHLAELYDDVPCPEGLHGCDLSLATPVEVTEGETIGGLDVELSMLGSGIFSTVKSGAGIPLAGVYVDVWDASIGRLSTTAVTGPEGRCLAVVPAGFYHVSTHNTQGQVDQVYPGISCINGSAFSGACAVTDGTQIEVLGGQITSGIDFVLGSPIFANGFESGDTSGWSATTGGSGQLETRAKQLGSITGTVTARSTGDPVSGVSLTVYDSLGYQVASTTSGAGGVYLVDSLVAGTYTAVAERPEWLGQVYDSLACSPAAYYVLSSQVCLWMDGTPIEVMPDAVTEGIDFALDRLGTISGTITNAATGGALSGKVSLWRFGWDVALPSLVNGEYGFAGLAPGDYYLAVTSPRDPDPYIDELYNDLQCFRGPNNGCTWTNGTPVTVALNTTITGIDFALEQGGVITGTISDAVTGQPVGNAGIMLFDAEGSEIGGILRSDAHGSWLHQGLPTGTYYIAASESGHLAGLYDGASCPGGVGVGQQCDPTSGTPIVVTAGQTTAGIDLSLQPYGAISGVVRDAATGLPVAGSAVDIYSQDGQLVSRVGQRNVSPGSGFYTSFPLEPGTYFAMAYGDRHDFQLYNGLPGFWGCDVTAGTPIVVAVGTTTRSIDFDLFEQLGGVITGTVSDDRTGNPLREVVVVVWDEGGDMIVAAAESDASGTYRIGGIEPGTYHVGTWSSPSGYLDELYNDLPMDADPAKGTPVAVSADATVTVDLALHFVGSSGILATVHDADSGEPLDQVWIDVWNAVSGGLMATTLTGPTGAALVAVPAGTYYLATDNHRGLVDQVFDGVACPYGPAYSGACNPYSGSPVVVVDDEVTEGVSFLLALPVIFRDGFESGDTSRWAISHP